MFNIIILETMDKQKLMENLFPNYVETIRSRNLQPYIGTVILPCRHRVEHCLIISIHECLHLVCEEASEEKYSYVYRGEQVIAEQ